MGLTYIVSDINSKILEVSNSYCESYTEVVLIVILVDYRVQPLVMLVKRWAKKHDINDASCGTLSSYALTLMVVHYLQGTIIIKFHLKVVFKNNL